MAQQLIEDAIIAYQNYCRSNARPVIEIDVSKCEMWTKRTKHDIKTIVTLCCGKKQKIALMCLQDTGKLKVYWIRNQPFARRAGTNC